MFCRRQTTLTKIPASQSITCIFPNIPCSTRDSEGLQHNLTILSWFGELYSLSLWHLGISFLSGPIKNTSKSLFPLIWPRFTIEECTPALKANSSTCAPYPLPQLAPQGESHPFSLLCLQWLFLHFVFLIKKQKKKINKILPHLFPSLSPPFHKQMSQKGAHSHHICSLFSWIVLHLLCCGCQSMTPPKGPHSSSTVLLSLRDSFRLHLTCPLGNDQSHSPYPNHTNFFQFLQIYISYLLSFFELSPVLTGLMNKL